MEDSEEEINLKTEENIEEIISAQIKNEDEDESLNKFDSILNKINSGNKLK